MDITILTVDLFYFEILERKKENYNYVHSSMFIGWLLCLIYNNISIIPSVLQKKK